MQSSISLPLSLLSLPIPLSQSASRLPQSIQRTRWLNYRHLVHLLSYLFVKCWLNRGGRDASDRSGRGFLYFLEILNRRTCLCFFFSSFLDNSNLFAPIVRGPKNREPRKSRETFLSKRGGIWSRAKRGGGMRNLRTKWIRYTSGRATSRSVAVLCTPRFSADTEKDHVLPVYLLI